MSDTASRPKTLSTIGWFLTVLIFFFISGACGLLYQVVWTRKLVLLFGTTSYAVSTVLSIYFLGLGLGSFWGGKLADRSKTPLQLYGLFEIIIGVWALLFIVTLPYTENIVVSFLKASGGTRSTGIALRACMATLFLFVPVTLMGATLPLLAKFINHESQVHAPKISALYTVNTLGAVAGCFLTGFFLIAHLGYTRATFLGAAANGFIGTLALVLSLRIEPTTSTVPAAKPLPPVPAHTQRSSERYTFILVLAAFFLSGFCALALEVLWTRLLAIVFLGTTYAYTTMLATLLCGIALGSAIAASFVHKIRHPMAVLGAVLIAISAGCLLSLSSIAAMPEKVIALHQQSSNDWSDIITGKVFLSFMALFLPTFFFGMTFPFVVKSVTLQRDTLGVDVGRVYGVNTFGGVLGALAGGYLLIPLMGVHNGMLLLAGLLALTGLLLTFVGLEKTIPKRLGILLACSTVLAIAWWQTPKDVSQSLNTGYIPKDNRILSYAEGVEGTVVVSEPEDSENGADRILWINRVQATTSIEKGVKMNRLQGVLPLLFDREPLDVLFMCFGSGITCGTLALSSFEHIDAVEICPEVLEAAPLFDTDNLGVLRRPRVLFHIDDGRNYLLTTNNHYDVITFEPMPLALAGVSTFYTKEYYESCFNHLKPGGLVSQWIPLHSLNPQMVRSLVFTFTKVFPEYCAWFINADLFLIGSNEALRLDYPRLQKRLSQPQLAEALRKVGFHDPFEVLACFLLDKNALNQYARGGEIMTDDRPWAEFEAPKWIYAQQVPNTLRELAPYATSPLPLFKSEGLSPELKKKIARRHRSRIHDLEALEAYYAAAVSIETPALPRFLESLDIDANNANAQYYIRRILEKQIPTLIRWEKYDAARQRLAETLARMPQDQLVLQLQQQLVAAQGAEKN